MTSLVNIKKVSCDVFIGRPSAFGNPFKIGIDGTRKDVISKYRKWFYNKLTNKFFCNSVLSLKDKTLGCYCKPKPCHGDIIIEFLENVNEFGLERTLKIINEKQNNTETIGFECLGIE